MPRFTHETLPLAAQGVILHVHRRTRDARRRTRDAMVGPDNGEPGRVTPPRAAFLPGASSRVSDPLDESVRLGAEAIDPPARGTAATVRSTLLTHYPAEGERVVLERGADGSVSLVLISPTADLVGSLPMGASAEQQRATLAAMNEAAARRWRGLAPTEVPASSRDGRGGEAARLRAQNEAARRFWGV
jgi:hypothetical protein